MYAQPIAGYDAGIQGMISLGRGLTEAAVGATPETMRADIPYLQETARREATINALNAAALERQLTPETSRMRANLSKQLEEDFAGGPSQELSNLWLRQGLADVISTGASSESGFARSALADKTRQDYYDNRQGLQDRVAAYLAANPMPVAGIDPGSLAGIISQVSADNINLRNAYQQQVLGYLGAQAQNASNAFQQQTQMEAARRASDIASYNQAQSQNAAARNAASAAAASNQASLFGAGIGAGGAIAGAGISALAL
jgi:hypothetical protein